jgi:glycosyltransferase involved in cell wall biosynthesis
MTMTDAARRGRVLHLVNGQHSAGAERVQDLLAGMLPSYGYEPGFVTLKNGVFEASRKHREAPLVCMPMRSMFDIGVANQVAAYALENDYQLLHSHTPRSALIAALAAGRAKLPMVAHVHSPSKSDSDNALGNLRNSLLEKFCLRRALRLLPVSDSLRRYLLANGYPAERIRTVPNGVPVRTDGTGKAFDGSDLVLGTVALFRPRKGTEVLLRAVAALRQDGVNVRLHAVGTFETPDYQRSVMTLVTELGIADAVHWTGFTHDVFAEFARMHAFVLPSLYGEGMPMVVLEAMSMALPVISTTVEGIPEVVREGRDGLLVAPDDVEAMAVAIRRLRGGEFDLAAMGRQGQARQREHFSDASMARLVSEVYQEVDA